MSWQQINGFLNQQPYNISMTVYINPEIENFEQFANEQSDGDARQSIKARVEVLNEIARQDFLEQELEDLASYDLALEIITRAKENK